jgi:uncharacterized protein YbcI
VSRLFPPIIASATPDKNLQGPIEVLYFWPTMTPDGRVAVSGQAHGELMREISREMVAAMKRDYGRGPISAKSYLIDDFLLVIMRGGLTTAEKTMLEKGREDAVREFRQIFENEMSQSLAAIAESLTGREVLTHQSQILFDPDIIIEIFFFADESDN